jgi:DNA-binding transcriptional ArsR family regulator
MRNVTKRMDALSDDNRLRLLMALRHGERCVCQLTALLELAPSTVSKHLSILRDADLLEARKDGRWVYYRLAANDDFPIVGSRAPTLFQSLEKSAAIRSDDRKMKLICKEDMEQLCRRLAERPKRKR